MDKEKVIDDLWERSNHGTRREDVVAAYEAGAVAEREACAKACEDAYTYQEDDPGASYAAVIRARSNAALTRGVETDGKDGAGKPSRSRHG